MGLRSRRTGSSTPPRSLKGPPRARPRSQERVSHAYGGMLKFFSMAIMACLATSNLVEAEKEASETNRRGFQFPTDDPFKGALDQDPELVEKHQVSADSEGGLCLPGAYLKPPVTLWLPEAKRIMMSLENFNKMKERFDTLETEMNNFLDQWTTQIQNNGKNMTFSEEVNEMSSNPSLTFEDGKSVKILQSSLKDLEANCRKAGAEVVYSISRRELFAIGDLLSRLPKSTPGASTTVTFVTETGEKRTGVPA